MFERKALQSDWLESLNRLGKRQKRLKVTIIQHFRTLVLLGMFTFRAFWASIWSESSQEDNNTKE